MPSLRSWFSFRWLLAITLTVLGSIGHSYPAYGQADVSFRIPDARPKSPNPRPERNDAASVRSTVFSKSSPASLSESPAEKEKRRVLKQAIEDGNKARDDNQYEAALASYEKVKELDPKDERAFFGLGNVYSDLACSDNAIKAYSDALRLKKDFRDAMIALAYAYANKERFDDAEAHFRALLKTNSNDVVANIGLAFLSGKRKQYQDAILKLSLISNNLSVEAKDRANAHLVLGDIYMEQREYSKAAVEFKKVIDLKHFEAGAYVKLGQSELFPAMSRFSLLVPEEVRIEDREKLIKAAKYAAENIGKAIYEHNYNHPFGYLLLAYAQMNQFAYQDADNNLRTYLGKVKELEEHSSFLAAKCNSFNDLYRYGYLALALAYHQQSLRETDSQRKAQFQDLVIENAKRLIQLKESDPSAYGLLGQIYLSKRRFPEAVEQFGKAITYETNAVTKASMYELLGFSYSNTAQDKEAIASYREALKLRPDAKSTLWGLAHTFEKKGDFDESIRLKKQAMGEAPVASSYVSLAASYFSRARHKKSEADFEEAIKLLKKALEVNESFGSAYFLLGQVYKFYKDGAHADLALENYEIAAKYNPRDASIYFNIGDLYYSVRKNHEAAIKYLRDALKLNPDFAEAYLELALVYRDKRDYAEAIKQLMQAIRANDKLQDAYFFLVDIYKTQKNYNEAIKYLYIVLDITPKEFWPYKELAKIHEAQQKNEDAIKYYQQAITLLKPDDVFGRGLYLCRIERLSGHYLEAINCFQKLKPPSSEDPGQQAYDIGLTYVASKNKKAAIAQHELLKQSQSALAEDLLRQINDMK